MKGQEFRTFLRTNPLTGRLITWGYRHYVAAICESAPNDCSYISKVDGTGRIIDAEPASSGGHEPCQLMQNGPLIKADSYYGRLNTDVISRFRGHHEPKEEKVFHEVLRSMSEAICKVEAGSYWRYYSLWAQKEKRKVRNILIEPLDHHIDLFINKLALNRMSGEFIRAYVGEGPKPPQTKKLEGVTIKDLERVSIDDLMTRMNLKFAHFIHTNIQGTELDIVRGSVESMRCSRIGYFFFSTHGNKLHAVCRDFRVEHQFTIVADHDRRESFSTDGLIVARSPALPGIDPVTISKNSTFKRMNAVRNYLLKVGSPSRRWQGFPGRVALQGRR